MKTITNIYDPKFEEYLIAKGFNLDTISMKESINELKQFNKFFKFI